MFAQRTVLCGQANENFLNIDDETELGDKELDERVLVYWRGDRVLHCFTKSGQVIYYDYTSKDWPFDLGCLYKYVCWMNSEKKLSIKEYCNLTNEFHACLNRLIDKYFAKDDKAIFKPLIEEFENKLITQSEIDRLEVIQLFKKTFTLIALHFYRLKSGYLLNCYLTLSASSPLCADSNLEEEDYNLTDEESSTQTIDSPFR